MTANVGPNRLLITPCTCCATPLCAAVLSIAAPLAPAVWRSSRSAPAQGTGSPLVALKYNADHDFFR